MQNKNSWKKWRKNHEEMISQADSSNTVEFKILCNFAIQNIIR